MAASLLTWRGEGGGTLSGDTCCYNQNSQEKLSNVDNSYDNGDNYSTVMIIH